MHTPAAKKRKTNHSLPKLAPAMNSIDPLRPAHPHTHFVFTTQRFKTPAKQNNSTTPSDQHSHSPNSPPLKIHDSHTPPSSDQGSPPNLHFTPKLSMNPHIYGMQEKQTDGEMPLITAETPMQHKNREFRRGGGKSKSQDPLAPTKLSAQSLQAFESTPSRSRRGSRASSIGSGHEALPHPRIPPSTLCRHIRTDLPPVVRCRTLVSWGTQKAEDMTYKILTPHTFKPTRIIIEELPKTILNAFNYQAKNFPSLLSTSSSSKSNLNLRSKFMLKIVKSAINNFVKGICENQVEINFPSSSSSSNPHQLNHDTSTSDDEDDQCPTVDLDSLPAHPQDLKNERKVKELEDWRTRMSYEDNARQYQLNRYGNLIGKLNTNQEDEETTTTRSMQVTSLKNDADQEVDLGSIDTKKLVDRESILEFGRFLRRREAAQQSALPRSIDTFVEHGTDWSHFSSNVGMIAENMNRIEERVRQVSQKTKEIQTSCTYKLGRVTRLSGGMSRIEAKMLLSSVDGIQLCLKSLNLVSPLDDLIFPASPPSSSSDHHLSEQLHQPLKVPVPISSSTAKSCDLGKRHLLRALASCHL